MLKRAPSLLLPLTLFAAFVFGLARVQFASPDLPDNDGYYHIKLAYLMRTEGLKPAFPYLPLTLLNADEFYDHHFLFHAALIPFTFGDLVTGAKWAAVTLAGLAFLAVWVLFQRQRVPWAWLWALALLGLSDAFLYRMSIPRAMSLSLGLLALGLVFLLEGRYKLLAALGVVYVWTYDAFPLLLALAALDSLSVLLIERRIDLRPLLYAGAGLAAGMLVNPYAPHNIAFSIQHLAPKLADATAVSVGNEWFPYETGTLLNNSFPALAAFAGAVLALGLAGRRMDRRTALALLAALLFGLMLFQARRFVEYFPAFALIFAAFAWAPLLTTPGPGPVTPAPPRPSPRRASGRQLKSMILAGALTEYRRRVEVWAGLPFLILALAVAAGMVRSIPRARELLARSAPHTLYAGAARWLADNTPSGARVFQTDWDDFPRLFFYNTHNTYLIGLDPTYLQLRDPNLYNAWVNITRGDLPEPSRVLVGRFGTRYVFSDLKHTAFLRQAEDDPGLREVYRDEQAVIYEVIGR